MEVTCVEGIEMMEDADDGASVSSTRTTSFSSMSMRRSGGEQSIARRDSSEEVWAIQMGTDWRLGRSGWPSRMRIRFGSSDCEREAPQQKILARVPILLYFSSPGS